MQHRSNPSVLLLANKTDNFGRFGSKSQDFVNGAPTASGTRARKTRVAIVTCSYHSNTRYMLITAYSYH